MSKRPPRNGEKTKELFNVLLVDGNSLFKTGYHGAKNSYNHRGEHIGGLYQFLTIIRKLLTEELYHRVYVFWDGNFSGKLRYDIYKPYKSGRGKDYINGTKPTDELELKQRLKVEQYLDELFIRQLKHETIESDDFIGYYCQTKRDNEKITICSNDRDMCQLISKDVRIYFCDKKTYVDKTNFLEHFYYHQENSVLIKTITGDNSDSIKGVKGVKEATLISLFPEIKTQRVTLSEVIEKSKILQQERINNKLKPLKVLSNIIDGVTDGVQGDRLYEINSSLVDLQKPLLTSDGIKELEDLIDGEFVAEDRGLKNVLVMMKQDGLERTIGENRYPEYLMPFKKLIDRELKQIKKESYEQES